METKKIIRSTQSIALIFLIALIILAVGMVLRNSIPMSSSLPTYTLEEGETMVQVSKKLVTTFEDIRIGGGIVVEEDNVDSDNETVTGLTMVLDFMDERFIVYKGLEWDYNSYHIRVLDVLKGSTVLAISSVE